jgi:hypothetical protein
MSPFFEAMYLSGMQESQSGEVTLKNINPQTFENILKFIYSGEDVINTENVESILQAATMLQIKCLKERCEEFMIENVDPENCIATWKLASSHTCSFLSRKAFKYVLYYFQDIQQTNEFLNLDYDDVLAIIKDNNLRTPNEESVCEAVFRWLNHDLDNRKQYIDKIMEHIRLPLMQPEYLLETLDTNTLVKENDKCRGYVEEAKRYHLLPARRHEFVSARLVHRNQAEYEEMIVCIGGNVHPEKTTTDVLCYSMKRLQWIRLASLPYDLGVEFAICTYGNAVYVSGGSEVLNGMVYLHALHNRWFKCRRMLIGRRRHCMVAVGDSLYVLGGYDDEAEEGYNTLISVEKFGVMSGSWEDCGYLISPVRSASASVLQDKIYVFGGLDGDGVTTSAVQCFDTRVRTCTHLTNLPSLSGMSSAVVCNKTTYLVFPSGEVLKMNGTGERCGEIESAGNIENFDRWGFGIVQHEGKIFIIGGIDSSDIFDEIIIFDPTTGERADSGGHYIRRPMFGFGCAKATIPQSVFRLS